MQASAPAFLARALWLWIALGVLGMAYMVLCPYRYHGAYWDFLAGLLVGIGLIACFVRRPRGA